MENVRRIYVEKKNGFDVEAKGVLADLKENLSLKGLKDVRIINRYDVSGVSDEEYQKARNLIFSEPPVDNAYDEELKSVRAKCLRLNFYRDSLTREPHRLKNVFQFLRKRNVRL